MAKETFTAKQREIVARKMGYDGPMQMFDEYLASSPADAQRFSGITTKYMAKGGMVRGYAAGGMVDDPSRPIYNEGREGPIFTGRYEQMPAPVAATPALAPAPVAPPPATPAPTPTPTPTTPPATTPAPATKAPVGAGAATYFQQNPDVAAAYLASDRSMSAQKFAETHYRDWGVAEGRSSPELASANLVPVAPTAGTVIAETTDTTLPGFKATAGQAGAVEKAVATTIATGPTAETKAFYKDKGKAAATDALKMATKRIPADLKYDLNGDGKVTSSDALGYEKLAQGKPLGYEPNVNSNYQDYMLKEFGDVAQVAAPSTVTADTVTAETTQELLALEQAKQAAATGIVGEGSKVTAAQGALSPEAKAAAETVGAEYKAPVVAGVRTTGEGELIKPVTDAEAVKATAFETAAPTKVVGAQGVVTADQLVQAQTIKEEDMAQATAIVSEGLAPDATVVAARLDKFTVDAGTLALAAQGNVDAQATVQGQLTDLMKSFDDGKTPAWAAGAIRAANAAMSSRGLGASSMAATAVFQAAMEAALPIAAQDAQTFAQMGMANLNNRQQTALTNAAAQQGLALQNLSNEQQARVANATNSFALQSQNLSNMQQTMLANTQIKAALQGQNLTNMQQAAVVNAARYAEQANINLNNVQQAALHNSSMQVQVDIANTSNKQQTALANAQLEAALQGKILDNRQQAAVLNATRVSENANMTFKAAETATLHNSEMMKSIGLAELNAAQSATIANAAVAASMDIANLNNLQQANVQNAKAFLETDLRNLDNKQQMAVLKSQQISQSITSDAAAKNAAAATNATNKLDADKINETLALTANQYNAAEKNKISVANMNAANELVKFNAEQANQRETFNANMTTQININNAKTLADISTANTAAVNAANAVNAKNATDLSASNYAQQNLIYKDLLEMSWNSGENEKQRATAIAQTTIAANATLSSAGKAADAASSSALGDLFGTIFKILL